MEREGAVIGARVGAILKEHHGGRYFGWKVGADGSFQFWVDRQKLRAERRVRAHLFVAHLALVLGVALGKALGKARLDMDLETALAALKPVRLVTLELNGSRGRVVTNPTAHARAVLKAVGLHQLSAPTAGSRCCSVRGCHGGYGLEHL